MDFSKYHLGVDGDSITAGDQWSWHVFQELNFATHHNVAVGSAVWYKRTISTPEGSVTTQNYEDEDFAGISGGWEPTTDLAELQMRANNCAVVHVQHFLSDVKAKKAEVPDVFVFAMGTNDDISCLGDAKEALTGKHLKDNAHIDLFTEAGAMRWCLQSIMEAFPKVRVFVMTPLQTAMPEHNEKIEKQIDTVMKKIAGAMGAQLIDCFHNCGICEKFEVVDGAGRYLRDGLHPQEEGQLLEGKYVAMEIRNRMF